MELRMKEEQRPQGRVRLQERPEEDLRLKIVWKQEEWPHCARDKTVKLNF